MGTAFRQSGNTRVMGTGDQARLSDAEVVTASLADPQAFATLFDRHAAPLHRYLTKRVGQQTAEDLVGETFATAFRARTSYDRSYPDARPWLFGIATNLVRHHWRAESKRSRTALTALEVRHEDDSEDIIARVTLSSHAQTISEALAQLDDSYLDVLLLIAGPGFSYEQVALALGIPVGTVRSRLFRARQQLRELLGDSRQYLDEMHQTRAPHCR